MRWITSRPESLKLTSNGTGAPVKGLAPGESIFQSSYPENSLYARFGRPSSTKRATGSGPATWETPLDENGDPTSLAVASPNGEPVFKWTVTSRDADGVPTLEQDGVGRTMTHRDPNRFGLMGRSPKRSKHDTQFGHVAQEAIRRKRIVQLRGERQ